MKVSKKPSSKRKCQKSFYFCLQRFDILFIAVYACSFQRQMEVVHNGSAIFVVAVVVVVVVVGQTSTFNNMHTDSKTIRFRLLTLPLYATSILYRIKFLCHFVLLFSFCRRNWGKNNQTISVFSSSHFRIKFGGRKFYCEVEKSEMM